MVLINSLNIIIGIYSISTHFFVFINLERFSRMFAIPFVKFENDVSVAIKTTGCTTVSSFITECKKQLELDVPPGRLVLYRSDGMTQLAGKLSHI